MKKTMIAFLLAMGVVNVAQAKSVERFIGVDADSSANCYAEVKESDSGFEVLISLYALGSETFVFENKDIHPVANSSYDTTPVGSANGQYFAYSRRLPGVGTLRALLVKTSSGLQLNRSQGFELLKEPHAQSSKLISCRELRQLKGID